MDDFKNGTAYNLDSFIFYKKKKKKNPGCYEQS